MDASKRIERDTNEKKGRAELNLKEIDGEKRREGYGVKQRER